MNLVHTLTHLRFILGAFSHLQLRFRSGLFPSGFLTQILMPSSHTKVPTYYMLLDLITLTISDEEVQLKGSISIFKTLTKAMVTI